MPISVNQELSFTDPNDVTVRGVVSGSKVVDEVDVSLDGQIVSTTALKEDASWNADISLSNQGIDEVSATVKYGDGTSEITGNLLIASNEPLDHQFISEIAIGQTSVSTTVYGQHGIGLYDATFVLDGQNEFADAIGRIATRIAYTDFSGTTATIENFKASGPNHDTLNLSGTSLLTLAQVLHHTTMSDGSATIHTGLDESVTLTGVTKAQLAAHPHDFVFSGGHTLAPTPS